MTQPIDNGPRRTGGAPTAGRVHRNHASVVGEEKPAGEQRAAGEQKANRDSGVIQKWHQATENKREAIF
jgi:hypothetical protein